MKLKTYQAYTMAEALAAVKRDLGQSAVILHTRTFRRGGFFGIGRKTIVEVTATIGEQPVAKPKPEVMAASPASSAAVGARRAYGMSGGGSSEIDAKLQAVTRRAAATRAEDVRQVTAEDRQRTRELARQLAEQYEHRAAAERAAADEASLRAEKQADSPTQFDDVSSPHTRRFVLIPATDAEKPQSSPKPDLSRVRQPVELCAEDDREHEGESRADETRAMQEELAAIREMVGQVLQRQTRTGSDDGTPIQPDMPQQLFDMYLTLIGQEISEELADRIISDVRDELTGEELNDETKVHRAMLQHLTDYIPIAQHPVPQHSPDDRPLTIALVGPTGVGKTTTVAKLAASFKLRHNRKVGLITSDTYRIAAVDQLRTYANIIGLPLKVALTPREMEQAVHALSDCDVILIDTAGRGQNDVDRLNELVQFIDAARPHEVHLVLSGTAGEKVLLREAEAFSQVGIDKIVLTKLDEAVSFGMLVNVVRQVGKELSFFTTGQEVPDHIEVGRPERLAELILGGKVHT